MKEILQAEIVVIGSGLSGLTAALRLQQAGHDVVVLEANDYVGGRVKNFTDEAGRLIEVGGRYLGPEHVQLLALADEFDVPRFDAHIDGQAIDHTKGVTTRFDISGERPMSDAAKADLARVMAEIQALAAELPEGEPWLAPRARELDGLSIAEWLKGRFTDPDAERVLTVELQICFPIPLIRVSFLHYLSVIAAGQKDETARKTQWRFVGGSSTLAQRIAAALKRPVYLGQPAETVTWETDGSAVVVTTPDFAVEAKRCVVAVNPLVAKYIEFSPPLPSRRALLHKEFQGASYVAMQMLYDTPFWQEDGLDGSIMSDLPFACWTEESSPPDLSYGAYGAMLSLVPRLPEWNAVGMPRHCHEDEKDRRDGFLSALTAVLGEKAANPIGYLEKDWGLERYATGCEAAPPPGLITEVGDAIRVPVGPLHWASTEHATRWPGWMEGAVGSGSAAAEEVHASLR